MIMWLRLRVALIGDYVLKRSNVEWAAMRITGKGRRTRTVPIAARLKRDLGGGVGAS